jgi:hypothetical protein
MVGCCVCLLSHHFSKPLQQSGITSFWWAVGAPAPATRTFQVGFHILVGLMMALFYAFVLEPAMPWSTTVKGLVYLAVVWLVNALIVLPATGEGFAGSANQPTFHNRSFCEFSFPAY